MSDSRELKSKVCVQNATTSDWHSVVGSADLQMVEEVDIIALDECCLVVVAAATDIIWQEAIDLYLYCFRNFSWNARNMSSISFSLAGWGRMVVRKWYVPGRWPNPEPGTMQIPVCSNSWNA